MRFTRFACIALAGLTTLMHVAHARNSVALEPAEFLTTRPGTTIVWKDVREGMQNAIRIEPRTGNRINYVTESGEAHSDYLMCWYCTGMTFDEDEYARLWPLEVGKEVRFVRSLEDETKSWINKIRVDRTEKVELPIGKVDTYVIETRSWIRGADRWYGKAEHWFSPALGWVVKTRSIDNYANRNEYVVVDIR